MQSRTRTRPATLLFTTGPIVIGPNDAMDIEAQYWIDNRVFFARDVAVRPFAFVGMPADGQFAITSFKVGPREELFRPGVPIPFEVFAQPSEDNFPEAPAGRPIVLRILNVGADPALFTAFMSGSTAEVDGPYGGH